MRAEWVACAIAVATMTAGCASGAGSPAEGARSPALAFQAEAGDLGGGCAIGPPRVVAERVLLRSFHPGEDDAWAGRTSSGVAARAWVEPASARVRWQVGDGETGAVALLPRSDRAVQPRVAELDDRRLLVTWTEGSLEGGMEVRAIAIGSEGAPLGPPVVVSSGDGSVVGRAATMLGDRARGEITFLESFDRGLRSLAAPVDCSP